MTRTQQIRTCVAVKTLPMNSDVEIECSGLVTKGAAAAGRPSKI